MSILIIIFGIVLLMAGTILLANPEIIFKLLRENADRLWLYISAVGVRLLLGVLLVYQANDSMFPATMKVIGWAIIIVALIFVGLGRKKFKRLIVWVDRVFKPFGKTAGVLALGFGAFLIYAFV